MSEADSTKIDKVGPRIGSYRLLQSLGSGGMSSVFRAVHIETGHIVALKVLQRALAKNGVPLQRFLREAKSAESLEHPNIVQIFDRGVDNGRYYLVLEYVEGGDLHERVRTHGPLGVGESLRVIRTVAKGLQFASSRGLIHRDIKPANILMTPSGDVKIIDLGLALQADHEDERVTREGTTVGTVDFMSPEQARDSRATSERSDIYSLGCTFYYLLTGSAPFPGGDIADKLSRHCLLPPPDPKELRPEVSASVSLLIRRMMAKKPEQRFANYGELIDELDVVPTFDRDPDATPLYAVIDDEGDDREATRISRVRFPIQIDDPDGPGVRLGEELAQAPTVGAESGQGEAQEVEYSGLLYAELTPLLDASQDEIVERNPSAPQTPPTPRPSPAAAPSFSSLVESESEEDEAQAAIRGPRPTFDDGSRRWITTCVTVGACIVLLIIGTHQLFQSASGSYPEPLEVPAEQEPQAIAAAPSNVPLVPESTKPPKARPDQPRPPASKSDHPATVTWTEPTDPVVELPSEPDYGAKAEAKFVPEWASAEIPSRISGNYASVHRVVDPRDSSQHPTLRFALDVIGGTIEIADNGPFFEDDLRISGETRLIRAREGCRPIVAVDTPQLEVVRAQPAVIMLEGKSLILDGLDLIVNVQDLPKTQSALVQCRGGSLTIRNSTITVVNPRKQPFAIVRSRSASAPNRIRIESTLIRGEGVSVVDFAGGNAEALIRRSALVCGVEPVVTCSGPDPQGDRRIAFVRSLVLGAGSVLDPSHGTTGARREPFSARALGTTFASTAKGRVSSLMVAPSESTRAGELIHWYGDHNRFAGWAEFLSSGTAKHPKIANLAAARSIWAGTDPHSIAIPAGIEIPRDLERIPPADLKGIAPELSATLARVAVPAPSLFEKSLEPFRKIAPPVPATHASNGPAEPPGHVVAPASAEKNSQAKELGFAVINDHSTPAPTLRARISKTNSDVRDVVFDPGSGSSTRDLGQFILEVLSPNDRTLRVRIRGTRRVSCEPIRLPDGVSLELLPDAPANGPVTPVSVIAAPSDSADALIEVHGGDLRISDVRLAREANSGVQFLVKVDRGNLLLERCWLSDSETTPRWDGGLVSFQAASTEPFSEARGLFEPSMNKPVCRLIDTLLITGGEALRAEVGRGFIAASNCAIASGSIAFSLRPANVARDRFDATLSLDHCTVAAAESFVELARWPGSAPGPDRPWLVLTRDNAFVAGYDRGARDTSMLRVEPESLGQGALFWQGANDAVEVAHFTSRTDTPPSPKVRPDVERQWVEFWGKVHMHNITGPSRLPGVPPSVRLLGKLRVGQIAPGDLALDPTYHPGRNKLDVGAELKRLRIETRRAGRR